MKRFGQSSRATRIAVGVIALYALLLHAFVAAAAPIPAFSATTHIACSHESARPGAPGDKDGRQHGHCCILGCAACAAAYVAISGGAAVNPARTSSAISWTKPPTAAGPAALSLSFRARGPPRTA